MDDFFKKAYSDLAAEYETFANIEFDSTKKPPYIIFNYDSVKKKYAGNKPIHKVPVFFCQLVTASADIASFNNLINALENKNWIVEIEFAENLIDSNRFIYNFTMFRYNKNA